MAEALFNQLAKGKAVAISAGTRPASDTDRSVIEAMFEISIDISNQWPKLLVPEMLENADRVITMGCDAEKACPASFVPVEDWELEDPEGKPMDEVRRIRDKIKKNVEVLVKELL